LSNSLDFGQLRVLFVPLAPVFSIYTQLIMKWTRRSLLERTAGWMAGLPLAAGGLLVARAEGAQSGVPGPCRREGNLPSMVEADGRLRFDFGEERMVLDGGLQPFLFSTASGALIVQAQSPNPPYPSPRMHYQYAMTTAVSRDVGKTWTAIPLKPGENGLNLEGGAVQLRDGRVLALDTYVTPGKRSNEGIGQLYVSNDDWRTLQGPEDVTFDLPYIDFYASKDDGGHPHEAERLHRRILELPNGDLLTTIYGWIKGDRTPSTYMPTMMKTRVMLVRSTDKGRRWKLVSTIAVNPSVGTEGFGEPVIVRVSRGDHAGRLICLMRTGRELYESFSQDEGATWTPARPRVFGGLDVYRTELWVDMFRNVRGRNGQLLDENNPDELRGAVVDPDLIELRSGLLVAAFGVRVPQKACWPHCEHPWNGNYIAVSRDGGTTWNNVVRLTSGVLTTHYMGVAETTNDNEVFVTYDYGYWRHEPRYAYGRAIKIAVKPARSSMRKDG
jgi:hypothetical protein